MRKGLEMYSFKTKKLEKDAHGFVEFFDENGLSFYDAQKLFAQDTVKVMSKNNIVVGKGGDISGFVPWIDSVIDEVPAGTHVEYDMYIFDGVLAGFKPSKYHTWLGGKWVVTEDAEKQKASDEDAEKQQEISRLLGEAAQKISEFEDLIEFASNDKEAAAGEAGYKAWRQYRAALLKYQKGFVAEMPDLPEQEV